MTFRDRVLWSHSCVSLHPNCSCTHTSRAHTHLLSQCCAATALTSPGRTSENMLRWADFRASAACWPQTDAQAMNSPPRHRSMQGMKCKSFKTWYCIVRSANTQDKRLIPPSSQPPVTHTYSHEPSRLPHNPHTWARVKWINHSSECSASSAFPESARDSAALTAWHDESQGSNEMHTLSATLSLRHNSEQQLHSQLKQHRAVSAIVLLSPVNMPALCHITNRGPFALFCWHASLPPKWLSSSRCFTPTGVAWNAPPTAPLTLVSDTWSLSQPALMSFLCFFIFITFTRWQIFWLKGCYYFASHNDFVGEGFAAVLMDGWPLPAVDERLNERGAVVTWLPTLWPKTGGGGGEGWVKKRAGTGWLDEDLAWDDVLKWDKVSEGWQRDRLGDGGEEVSVGWGSPNTPVPEVTAETEMTLCKNRESRWNEHSQ